MNKNRELIFENRFQINPEISNTKLRKLCNFYKNIYMKNSKERTLRILQKKINRNLQKTKQLRIEQNQVCTICMEPLTETMLITRCMHSFCDKCILNYLNYYNQSCPICRHSHNIDMFVEDKQLTLTNMVYILSFQLPVPTSIRQSITRQDIAQNPIQEYIENENIDLSFLDNNSCPFFIYNFMNHISKNHIIYMGIFTLMSFYTLTNFVYINYNILANYNVLA